jgi:hypothetical protein
MYGFARDEGIDLDDYNSRLILVACFALKRRGCFAGLLFTVQVRELRSVIVFAEYFLGIKPRTFPRNPKAVVARVFPVELRDGCKVV